MLNIHCPPRFLLAILLCGYSLSAAQTSAAQDSALQNNITQVASPTLLPTWLSGCWASESDEAGSGEYWSSGAGGQMFGLGRTLRQGKIIAHEFMHISSDSSGKLLFTAHPSGKKSVTFSQIVARENEVIFENLQHDFPQRVIYRLSSEKKLTARIEGLKAGQTRGIDFAMRRMSCDNHSPQ